MRNKRAQIKKAVRDNYLKTAMERSAVAYAAARAEAVAGIDFDELQGQVRSVKERSVSRLRELADRFKAEAEKAGVVVYEAKDAADANAYIARIAAERGVKMAVKSKSMLTEEIGLNPHLESKGIKVVETDLGEWIIQLAGEKPSHFTQPAVHKTREQVAELFSKVVGYKVEPDIPTLVEIARNQLRQAFVEADMGISGANIVIAETGTLVIVTNEGNSRLVTTFPPVHVAVVGYEKLVETMDDANDILKLLSKSGTGQKFTAYVSFITGPSRTTDIEKTLAIGVHGPKEVHVVLVDNGRMKMQQDEDIREALYCVKCGACLNVCPVMRSIGGHAYSNTYIGAIGAVVTSFHNSLRASEGTIGLCTGCRKCVTVCPAKVDVPEMTLALRNRMVEKNGLGMASRFMLRGMLKNPDVMRKSISIASKLQTPFARNGRIGHVPFILPGFRTTPAISDVPLANRLPERTAPKGEVKAKVALFAGCMAEFVYPEIAESAARVMVDAGAEVIYPQNQACCGAPAMYAGDFDTAESLAIRNVGVLEAAGADYIVTVCPTCAVELKNKLPELLKDTEYADRAKEIADKVRDFSDFAANVLGLTPAKVDSRVTYHDPCHQVRGVGGCDAPRELIGRAGADLVEMPDCDVCCGFAGSYSMKWPEISQAILERKLKNVESVDPEVVVTDCPGCIMQIRGGLEKKGSRIKVCHTAELLDRAEG